MKLARKILFFGIIIFAFIFVSTSIESTSYADAGNFRGNTNYSRGGNSFSRSHSGRSHSSSRSYGNSSGYRGSGGFFGIPFFGFGMTPFVVILFIVIFLMMKKHGGSSTEEDDSSELYLVPDDNLEMLYNRDPNFDENTVKEKVGRIYVEMQNHWQSGDWEPMRAYLTPQLYSRLENQLENMKKAGQQNFVLNIAVLNVELLRFDFHDDIQVLDVLLETRAIDYTADSENHIVSGDPYKEVFMGYIYHMVRNINTTTPDADELKSMKCPNCGAPIDLNRSAKCEYCGAIIEAKDYDWVVSEIEGVYQSDHPR